MSQRTDKHDWIVSLDPGLEPIYLLLLGESSSYLSHKHLQLVQSESVQLITLANSLAHSLTHSSLSPCRNHDVALGVGGRCIRHDWCCK